VILDKSQVQGVIDRAVDQVNQVLLDADAIQKDRATVLVGDGAVLDSMGFVNFVVAIEDQLAEAIGLEVNLIEEINAVEEETSRPKTLCDIGEFLLVLAQKASK
jgi:acyl carrier protein